MSWYLLGVVTHSLRRESPAQRPIFNCAIECTWELLELYMYARYKSHNDATLSYMEDALCRFHAFKDVFLLGRAGNDARAKASAVKTDLVKMGTVDWETNAETWKPSKKRHGMNAWRDYFSHEIVVTKESGADFNFSNVRLMSHWVEQICRYGAWQQYSAKRHEQVHKTNLKDGWNAFNHNLDYLPHVITFQRRILGFQIRVINLEALAQHPGNSAATCNVLPSGTDLAAPLSSQSYAKPKFMGPHNRHDEKHPDNMIKDFQALLDNTQDAMRRVTIYNGTGEFLKHTSRDNPYLSHEQLHAKELCIDDHI